MRGDDGAGGRGVFEQDVARRTVLKGMGAGAAAGAAVALIPSRVSAAQIAFDPNKVINVNAKLTVDVVRPDDFLRFTFRFVNMTLDTSVRNHPVLRRKKAGQAAMV